MVVDLERFRSGDRDYLETVIKDHGWMVRKVAERFARGSLEGQIEADDLYQTVWKRILVRPEAYEGKGAFEAWLFRVATNVCANEVRRESTIGNRLLRAFRIDWFRDHIWRPPLPDEAVLSEERHEFLRRALAGVPPRQAEAVHLRYFEERTWREVAEIMGIKESTVRSLVSKGIQFVRDLEKEFEYGMP